METAVVPRFSLKIYAVLISQSVFTVLILLGEIEVKNFQNIFFFGHRMKLRLEMFKQHKPQPSAKRRFVVFTHAPHSKGSPKITLKIIAFWLHLDFSFDDLLALYSELHTKYEMSKL